jgi:hypothetical protein
VQRSVDIADALGWREQSRARHVTHNSQVFRIHALLFVRPEAG